MVYNSRLPTINIPKTGFLQFLFANKYNSPDDRPLLIDSFDTNRFLTFGQIKKKTLQLAAGLQDLCDFKTGDVLAMFSPNEYTYSLPVYGAIAAGGSTTTANPGYNVDELLYQLSLTKAKVLICHPDNIETALTAGHQAGIKKENIFIFGDKVIQGIQPFQKVLIRERAIALKDLTYDQARETTAMLCFSSGTSGRSKGVITTHTNLIANICQYASIDSQIIDGSKDRMLGILPFYHAFGLMVNLSCGIFFGFPIYVMSHFHIETFCQAIQNHKITIMTIVPPICLLLAKHDAVLKYNLSSWRFAISGAGPLGANLLNETRERIPNLVIRQLYGLTETSPVSTLQPIDEVVVGSAGILYPNMTAKIVDDEGNEITQPGVRGELWLKGPNISKGYLYNPEATAESIDKEGYFKTGDIVVTDSKQHFYIIDRKKELIKYKGFQVAPAEIESVLLKHPSIADCAVIGVYDVSTATEIPRAYITLKEHLVESEKIANEIMQYVAEKVIYYKQVRSVCFIPVIPKNPSGKILRRVLRDTAQLMQDEKKVINKSKL